MRTHVASVGKRKAVGTHPIVLEVRRVVEGARGAAAVQVGVVGAVHHLGAAHRHPARRRRPIAAPARPPRPAALAAGARTLRTRAQVTRTAAESKQECALGAYN